MMINYHPKVHQIRLINTHHVNAIMTVDLRFEFDYQYLKMCATVQCIQYNTSSRVKLVTLVIQITKITQITQCLINIWLQHLIFKELFHKDFQLLQG
jgi:hypothetical protein